MPMRVKKTERLQLRLTPAEKEKLTEKAAAARMSASDYVAELIDKKKVINEKTIFSLIYEIRKIGVNINQIAYIGNSQRYVPDELLRQVHQDMNEVNALVQKILSEIYDPNEHTISSLEEKIIELMERVDGIGGNQGN